MLFAGGSEFSSFSPGCLNSLLTLSGFGLGCWAATSTVGVVRFRVALCVLPSGSSPWTLWPCSSLQGWEGFPQQLPLRGFHMFDPANGRRDSGIVSDSPGVCIQSRTLQTRDKET